MIAYPALARGGLNGDGDSRVGIFAEHLLKLDAMASEGHAQSAYERYLDSVGEAHHANVVDLAVAQPRALDASEYYSAASADEYGAHDHRGLTGDRPEDLNELSVRFGSGRWMTLTEYLAEAAVVESAPQYAAVGDTADARADSDEVTPAQAGSDADRSDAPTTTPTDAPDSTGEAAAKPPQVLLSEGSSSIVVLEREEPRNEPDDAEADRPEIVELGASYEVLTSILDDNPLGRTALDELLVGLPSEGSAALSADSGKLSASDVLQTSGFPARTEDLASHSIFPANQSISATVDQALDDNALVV